MVNPLEFLRAKGVRFLERIIWQCVVSQDCQLLGVDGNDLIYPVAGTSPAFSSVGSMLTLYGLIRKFLIWTLSHPYRGAGILVFSTRKQ